MISLNEANPGNFVIDLEQSFDFESHKEFRECIKNLIDKNAKSLAIDFGRVEYIDSSALGMLMLAKHETSQHDCKLQLTNLKEGHAKNVLNLVKFDQMFDIKYA